MERSRASNSSGISVRLLRAMTLRELGVLTGVDHDVLVADWSRTARLKIECSIVWYLRIDLGESPRARLRG
jgi:hypothetical protein